jgi:hypothetical protein
MWLYEWCKLVYTCLIFYLNTLAMIQNEKLFHIQAIWGNYIRSNKVVLDTNGKEFAKYDDSRLLESIYIKSDYELFLASLLL